MFKQDNSSLEDQRAEPSVQLEESHPAIFSKMETDPFINIHNQKLHIPTENTNRHNYKTSRLLWY